MKPTLDRYCPGNFSYQSGSRPYTPYVRKYNPSLSMRVQYPPIDHKRSLVLMPAPVAYEYSHPEIQKLNSGSKRRIEVSRIKAVLTMGLKVKTKAAEFLQRLLRVFS